MKILGNAKYRLLAILLATCMSVNASAAVVQNNVSQKSSDGAFSWLREKGITACTSYCDFRSSDPITFEELVVMFMRTFYKEKWNCCVLKDDARGWAYEYCETASFIGLFGPTERVTMETRITNRDLWRWVGRCSSLRPYPAWCYDGTKSKDDPERDVEFALKATGLCNESINPDATPTRGEVAELLYRLDVGLYTKLSKPSIVNELPLLIENNVTDRWEVRNSILHDWAILPEKVQKEFLDKGWKIRILRSLSEVSPDLTGYIGYTDLEAHEIDFSAIAYNTGENIFLHEIGHFLSPYMNEPLIQWYMYDAEKEAITSLLSTPYGNRSREELFAEAVRCVLSTPTDSSQYKKLQQEIPFSLAVIEEGFLKSRAIYDSDAVYHVQEKYWNYLQNRVNWRIE